MIGTKKDNNNSSFLLFADELEIFKNIILIIIEDSW